MLGPMDYVLWTVSFAAEAYLVVCCIARREFFRYVTPALYMFAAAAQNAALFFVYRHSGFQSVEYRYVYYYSDSLLTLLMFFVISELYQHTFSELRAKKQIRFATVLLLGLTMIFSYLEIRHNLRNFSGRFVVGLGQNLYFVGVVLTYLLWGALLKLRETRTRLIQLILSLGIYFSATAATAALRNMLHSDGVALAVVKQIQPLAGTFLPLAWAYTFTKIPEEARLATAQVAMPHR